MNAIKQIKIWKRQARMWMRVCHEAMSLFPNRFGTFSVLALIEPKQSPAIIIDLLRELAGRQSAVSVTISRINAETGATKIGRLELRRLRSNTDPDWPWEIVRWSDNSGGCYTLAWWINEGKEGPSLHFIGDRPLSSDVDWQAFKVLAQEGHERAMREWAADKC